MHISVEPILFEHSLTVTQYFSFDCLEVEF
jgi:hypothetical protein